MTLAFTGIATSWCDGIRCGRADANGQQAVLRTRVGSAGPCRHCLELIADEESKLVLAYRPFDRLHAFAETGPIFLHAWPCRRYESATAPAWFHLLDPAIVRGYDDNDGMRYDTGSVVRGEEIMRACQAILDDATIAYVHVRSKYNCFQCRVDRVLTAFRR
jgi:hypothetical protein